MQISLLTFAVFLIDSSETKGQLETLLMTAIWILSFHTFLCKTKKSALYKDAITDNQQEETNNLKSYSFYFGVMSIKIQTMNVCMEIHKAW